MWLTLFFSQRRDDHLRRTALAVGMGGNIRVGLEDSLWIGPGELATSNAAQVLRARQVIENLGMELATPAEAREILSLKGADNVAF
ncbi:MAG TPA: 3-keto-5-aminohexanoate cleavage protein [Chthoniobacterales bacterium]